MRIAVVQTRPVRGDVARNVAGHLELLQMAHSERAEVVVFPELSLSGYEPELARELALRAEDPRLDAFQEASDASGRLLAVGAPIRSAGKPCIGLVIFRPRMPRQVYSKRYLHEDELPFFVRGEHSSGVLETSPRIALAICYELSVPEHARAAFEQGAGIYLASVAKSAGGVERAQARLSDIAREHGVPALMANCVGPCGGFDSAGGSAVWDRQGRLLARLDDVHEGLLVLDTETEEARAVLA
jgi:predicted amidohydrolase